MKVILDNGEEVGVSSLSFEQFRRFMAELLGKNPCSGTVWDLLTGLRGPDSPSERPDLGTKANATAYTARRDRKYRTVEVIRAAAFYGTVGGSARRHQGDSIQLPPQMRWDHFDKHAARAAQTIGLKVETSESY